MMGTENTAALCKHTVPQYYTATIFDRHFTQYPVNLWVSQLKSVSKLATDKTTGIRFLKETLSFQFAIATSYALGTTEI
jgi:hypothetical protein